MRTASPGVVHSWLNSTAKVTLTETDTHSSLFGKGCKSFYGTQWAIFVATSLGSRVELKLIVSLTALVSGYYSMVLAH